MEDGDEALELIIKCSAVQGLQRQARNLKTYQIRVLRDIEWNVSDAVDDDIRNLLTLPHRLLDRKRKDENKLDSVHEPHVEYINNGKINKMYEFGRKVGVAMMKNMRCAVTSLAFHGNL